MAITASMVKELRDSTGAGMMDAKKALTESDGDMDAAVDWLRTKGLAKAAKKSGRTAAEGLVAVNVANGVGVAVEVNSETDFVGKNAEFQGMVSAIAGAANALHTARTARLCDLIIFSSVQTGTVDIQLMPRPFREMHQWTRFHVLPGGILTEDLPCRP